MFFLFACSCVTLKSCKNRCRVCARRRGARCSSVARIGHSAGSHEHNDTLKITSKNTLRGRRSAKSYMYRLLTRQRFKLTSLYGIQSSAQSQPALLEDMQAQSYCNGVLLFGRLLPCKRSCMRAVSVAPAKDLQKMRAVLPRCQAVCQPREAAQSTFRTSEQRHITMSR